MKNFIIILLMFSPFLLKSQVSWDGQVSAFGNYSPDNQYYLFLGGRYIPEIQYSHSLDSGKSFDVLASADISGSILSDPFQDNQTGGNLAPY